MTSKRLKLLIRLFVSATLLGIVYSQTNAASIAENLSRIGPATAFLMLGLYALGQLLSAGKWKILLAEARIARSLVQATKAYFSGMFVNSFGLGTLGGDLTRCLHLRPIRGEKTGIMASVVADRMHGLTVLATIGALASFYIDLEIKGYKWGTLALFAVIALSALWCLAPTALRGLFSKSDFSNKIGQAAALAFPRPGRAFYFATAISVAFHCIQIYMHYAILKALGAPLEIGFLFACVPLINIASSLPISVNGLGIRESMYLLLFSSEGISSDTAAATGAVWILTVTIVSALGGVFLLGAEKKENQADDSSAEMESQTKNRHRVYG